MPMSTQVRDVIKKLPHLTNCSPPKSLKSSKVNMPVRETRDKPHSNSKSWREWKQAPKDKGLPSEDSKSAATTRIKARPNANARSNTSEERSSHVEKENIFTIYESLPSQLSPNEYRVNQLRIRHKAAEDPKSSGKVNHKLHQQKTKHSQKSDLQLPEFSLESTDENKPGITDNKQHPRHASGIYENGHYKYEYEHEHQQLSLLTASDFDSSYHHLNECPFYTSEVSNLKLRVIELEFINATLENKVLKYRDEIRLFKKDIKGYKSDGQQFTQILTEKENEILILHRKIIQLLNQDTLPSPPLSLMSPRVNGTSSSSSNDNNNYSDDHKRNKSSASPMRRQISGSSTCGKYVRTLGHIDEEEGQPGEHKAQLWI